VGLSPAYASAAVHTAEVFTTGASAVSHIIHKNIARRLVTELAVAGSIGAIIGAYILSNIDGSVIRPFVAAYLLILGLSILLRALRAPPESDVSPTFAAPLGIIGGFLDAIGGGGWGPMVTSTLLGSGHAPRMSVNTAEFFGTVSAATTFFVELGLVPIQALAGLTVGGVLAAPLGRLLGPQGPRPTTPGRGRPGGRKPSRLPDRKMAYLLTLPRGVRTPALAEPGMARRLRAPAACSTKVLEQVRIFLATCDGP
jgi:hypothetical protein